MPHITLPTNFLASTTQAITTYFGDFSPIFYLVLGLLGLGVIIEIVIHAIRPK